MSDAPLVNLNDVPPAQLCERFGPEPEALALLGDGMPAEDFLRTLIAAGHLQDAVQFLAQALPKREAVAWACYCARDGQGESLKDTDVAALSAAEEWVRQPEAETARAAELAAEATGLETPAGMAAIAAFWSGDSMAPDDLPPVPPGDDLTGKGVAGAVMLAAVAGEVDQIPQRYRHYLDKGLMLAAYTPPENA